MLLFDEIYCMLKRVSGIIYDFKIVMVAHPLPPSGTVNFITACTLGPVKLSYAASNSMYSAENALLQRF